MTSITSVLNRFFSFEIGYAPHTNSSATFNPSTTRYSRSIHCFHSLLHSFSSYPEQQAMASYQHVTFAGGPSKQPPLIDPESFAAKAKANPGTYPSRPGLYNIPLTTSLPGFREDKTYNPFWGENWEGWTDPALQRPAPAAEPTTGCLLDAPIPDEKQAGKKSGKQVKEELLTLKRVQASLQQRDHQDDEDSDHYGGAASTVACTMTSNRADRPRRFPRHMLSPVVIPSAEGEGGSGAETVDLILDYLERRPRRRRWQPDFDDVGNMDAASLRRALKKVLGAVRFLVRDNERLERDGKGGSSRPLLDVGQRRWRWDEHMDLQVLLEKSETDIEGMQEDELRAGIGLARKGREELLGYNEEMLAVTD